MSPEGIGVALDACPKLRFALLSPSKIILTPFFPDTFLPDTVLRPRAGHSRGSTDERIAPRGAERDDLVDRHHLVVNALAQEHDIARVRRGQAGAKGAEGTLARTRLDDGTPMYIYEPSAPVGHMTHRDVGVIRHPPYGLRSS